MDIRLKTYKKSFDHSYTMGVFPTIELLQFQPQIVITVLIHSKGKQNRGIRKIIDLCQQQDINYQVNDHRVEALSRKDNVYAIGVFEKREHELDQTRNHVLLVNPSSMGNLGTIMRTMLGFGYEDLGIIEPAADSYDPSTVRASMGALFHIRLQKFEHFSEYVGRYLRRYYLLKSNGEIPLPKADFETPHTLVFGNESAGLDDDYDSYGQTIRIPQNERIDSLNLAVSVGITLYQVAQTKP